MCLRFAVGSRDSGENRVELATLTEERIVLEPGELLAFCGRNDRKIRQLAAALEADIVARGNELAISGEPSATRRAIQNRPKAAKPAIGTRSEKVNMA